MRIGQPSDTFKLLYYDIIEELLIQILKKLDNYSIRYKTGDIGIHIEILNKFEEYKIKALSNMSGNRLDRHKLASCICGAIIEVKPLVATKGKTIPKNANEIFALFVGLNVIKFYMIYSFVLKTELSPIDKVELKEFFKENFDMNVPYLEENICDSQEYRKNMANALFWSHHECTILKKECFHFDIWAYSKIFYHLEIYNDAHLKEIYEEYLNKQ